MALNCTFPHHLGATFVSLCNLNHFLKAHSIILTFPGEIHIKKVQKLRGKERYSVLPLCTESAMRVNMQGGCHD